jgi:hypothetical protein
MVCHGLPHPCEVAGLLARPKGREPQLSGRQERVLGLWGGGGGFCKNTTSLSPAVLFCPNVILNLTETPECKSMYKVRRQKGMPSLTSWTAFIPEKGGVGWGRGGFNTAESHLRG